MMQTPSQPSLLSSGSEIPPRRVQTLCDRLAAFFRAHEGEWLDGMELARIAGSYAWRTRCSDLRRAPYLMVIENRKRCVENIAYAGRKVTVSEYRFVREGL